MQHWWVGCITRAATCYDTRGRTLVIELGVGSRISLGLRKHEKALRFLFLLQMDVFSQMHNVDGWMDGGRVVMRIGSLGLCPVVGRGR